MKLICPRCSRKLISTLEGEGPPPAFCMYCGQKLRDDLPPPAPVMPDLPGIEPSQQTRTIAYSPSAASSGSPGGSPGSLSWPEPIDTPSTVTLTVIAGYRITRFLGAGGMGTVYEAQSSTTGSRVAVKLLSPKLAANPASVERFRQEGRVASQITHPRCVFVLQADTEEGRPFIIMELMPGRTLKDLVDSRGPLPYPEAIRRILDVIDGLAEAHRLGVIHRDVKPSNCFLTDDNRIKVGDFGPSKSLLSTMDFSQDAAAKQLTESGAFLGTVMYASPEQIRGEAVSYDSDVYSVCATLYYLLTGRAPFQNESLTAALAKAVSEPPPPIRDRFPEVPRELEKVILRGLERDRTRRWQNLEELRDELVELQADQQQPASVRGILLAYTLDTVLLQLLSMPLEILRQSLYARPRGAEIDFLSASWPGLLISFLYFAMFEGLTGATPGKRWLRLAVVRLGGVGPPGLAAASLRALVFLGLWTVMILAPEWLNYSLGMAVGIPLGLVISALCLVGLALQLRRTTYGRRGLHDWLSQTRVIQRPRPPHRPRLFSQAEPTLERIVPTSEALPATLGGYLISGKHCDLPDGGEIWLGEDRVLGRRVLLRLLPRGTVLPPETLAENGRPTTLRRIGTGTFDDPRPGASIPRGWIAYVAPTGAPLLDVITPGKTLGWIDARPILEELTDELIARQASAIPFEPTAIEQIWVEPNGRLQQLDFPLPTGRRGVAPPLLVAPDPESLLRATATLILEGTPRMNHQPVAAPIPPHAQPILRRLFRLDRAYPQLTDFKQALAENHQSAPVLTASARAGHLGILSLMVSFPITLMYFMSWTLSFFAVLSGSPLQRDYDGLAQQLREPTALAAIQQQARQTLRSQPEVLRNLELVLSADRISMTLERLEQRQQMQLELLKRTDKKLNRLERTILRSFLEQIRTEILERQGPSAFYTREMVTVLPWLINPQAALPTDERPEIRPALGLAAMLTSMAVVLGLSLFAFIFRGGISNRIAGVTIIRADGRPAPRWLCFLREWLVWLPILLVCLLGVLLQITRPESTLPRTALLFVSLLLIPLYIVIALRGPDRPPQDRLLGTHLMPE